MLTPKDISSEQLEAQVQRFGTDLMTSVHASLPLSNKLENKLFQASSRYPQVKAALLRLVDVIPVIHTPQLLAQHISEYLEPALRAHSRVLARILKLACGPTLAPISARIARSVVTKMARRFIAGRDGQAALPTLQKIRAHSLAFTVDLLGEYSVGEPEAIDYLQRYQEVLNSLADATKHWPQSTALIPGHIGERSPICISIKLSALYSQCDVLNLNRSVDVLSERLTTLALQAHSLGATLYVDAEDSATNKIIYRTFIKVFSQQKLCSLAYPGIVVQAYSREAAAVLDDLLKFARRRENPIAVRLVKGAYWDSETVVAVQNGLPSPLFSCKQSSDANYETLARFLIDNHEYLYPAFGSHNVRSLSYACSYAEQCGLAQTDFEIQMLYGMAAPIAKAFVDRGYLVRMYVALGALLPGMGYLVRRLLENTSNESFLRAALVPAQRTSSLLRRPQLLD